MGTNEINAWRMEKPSEQNQVPSLPSQPLTKMVQPDGSVNHGTLSSERIGQAFEKHQQNIDATKEQVEQQIDDKDTPPELKKWLILAQNSYNEGIQQVMHKTEPEIHTMSQSIDNYSVVVKHKAMLEKEREAMIQQLQAETNPQKKAELKKELLNTLLADLDNDGRAENSSKNKYENFIAKLWRRFTQTEGKADGDNNNVAEIGLKTLFKEAPNALSNFAQKHNIDINTLISDSGNINQEGINKFQNALQTEVDALATIQQALTGTSNQAVDVVTVLMGQDAINKYVQGLLQHQEELAQLMDTVDPKTKETGFEKLAKALINVGITIALPWTYVRYQTAEMHTPNGLVKIDPNDVSQLGQAISWKKTPEMTLVGKGKEKNVKVALDFLSARLEWNFNDQEEWMKGEIAKIVNTAKEYQEKFDANNQLPKNEVEWFIKKMNLDPTLAQAFRQSPTRDNFNRFVDTIAHQKMIEIAQASGWEFKGVEWVLNPLGLSVGLGASAQKLSVHYRWSDAKTMNALFVENPELRQQWQELMTFVENPKDPNNPEKSREFTYSFQKLDGVKEFLDQFARKNNLTLIDAGDSYKIISEKVFHIERKAKIVRGETKIDFIARVMPKADIKTTKSQLYTIDGATMEKSNFISTIERAKEEWLKFLSFYVASYNRTSQAFDGMIVNISNGDYDTAYKKLQSFTKPGSGFGTIDMKNMQKILQAVQTPEGNMDKNKMLALLTYTYGARGVKDKMDKVSAKEYAKSRESRVLTNEHTALTEWIKRMKVEGELWFSIDEYIKNDEQFRKIDHIPQEASLHAPDQRVAVAVVATPNQKGTDRVDNYPMSMSVSNKAVDLTDNSIKKWLIKANIKMIEEELWRLNDFLKQRNKGPVTLTQYTEMLLSKDTSKLGIPTLSFNHEPKFLETRAMVNENICNNLTFIMALPDFKIASEQGEKSVTEVQSISPKSSNTVTFGSNAAAITSTTIGGWWSTSLKKEAPKKEEPKKTPDNPPKTTPPPQTPPPSGDVPNTYTPPPPNVDVPKIEVQPPPTLPDTTSITAVVENVATPISGAPLNSWANLVENVTPHIPSVMKEVADAPKNVGQWFENLFN